MQENLKLFNSRRFWVAVMDMVISCVLFGVAHFAPQSEELVKFFVVAIQPVLSIIIVAYTVDDIARNAGIEKTNQMSILSEAPYVEEEVEE